MMARLLFNPSTLGTRTAPSRRRSAASLPLFGFVTMLLVSDLIVPTAGAAADPGKARADYRNISSQQATTEQKNPGVAFFSGYINSPHTQTATDGSAILQECALGQSFSQWYPSDNFGATVAANVKALLYPTATTPDAIKSEGKPFRYKYLLYSGTGTDVTAFDPATFDSDNLFTDADRNTIKTEIAAIEAAIAASPLDTGLRNLLLDVYYDWAVAEMQESKVQLANLAKYHLGITQPPAGQFIIDKEIASYDAIDTAYQKAIAAFSDLLSMAIPDIDPSDFDNRVAFGTPMGQYIFRIEEPTRNSVPSQYANDSGIHEVPQMVNGQVVTPGTLFTGYKDLNALLQIIGQRLNNLTSLCRMRGTRQATDDISKARQAIAQAAGADNTDLQLIKSWFSELFPPDLKVLTQAQLNDVNNLQQQSGVFAALAGIESGRNDLMSVTPFLNGSANILGYDPDFLLLAQDQGNNNPPLESYDVLRNMLTANNNAPLTVALNKLGTFSPPTGAIGLYQNFLDKVEEVASDIDTADTDLADRYFAITGYEPGASPGYDKTNPNSATPGSELGGALATIAALQTQANLRKGITTNFDNVLTDNADKTKGGYALQSITLAMAKQDALNSAVDTYKSTTSPLYDSNTAAKTAAAVSQALADAAYAAIGAAGNDNVGKAIVGAGAAIAVGAANAAVQGETAKVISNNEKNIDYAGVDLSAATSAADVPLTVNQARLDLESLKRDQIANDMSAQSDNAALSQAFAHESSLLSELDRIEKKRDANVAAIRKKSYADPLQYYRAESALIDADESFATAQRWMFYTVQALNYKWNGKFAITQGSKSYDTSSVFKCRNAAELNDLLTQMQQWDSVRVTQTTNSSRIYTDVSLLNDVLARNPRRFSTTDSSDPGTRADDSATPRPMPLPAVETQQYFRNLLARKYKDAGSGDLVIPFSTVFPNQAADRVDGNFFRGATYDASGNCLDPGFWREKIEYVKVNVFASNAPSTPKNLSGGLTYGGATYFHTRVPPRSDRTVGGTATDDAPGELLVAPFRFWVSPDFSQNFIPQSQQIVSIPVAYSQSSAFMGGTTPDNLDSSFQVNAFTGRSIAASGWNLRIARLQSNGFVVDAKNINDIEVIVAYKHSDRIFPPN
jgi:hypothetical protein